MTVLMRNTPLLLFFTLFALFIVLIVQPALFWPVVVAIAIVAFFGTSLVQRWRTEERYFWHCLGTVVAFLGSSIALFVFVSGTWVGYALVLLVPGLTGWFLQNLFWYYHEPHHYQLRSIEIISSYLIILTSLFFFSSLLAVRTFFTFSLLMFFVLGTAFSFLVFFQSTWLTKRSFAECWPYIGIGTLALLEMLGAVLTLPTSTLSGGIVLALLVYCLTQLFRHHIEGTLEGRTIRRYSIACGVVMFLIFLTAPWT